MGEWLKSGLKTRVRYPLAGAALAAVAGILAAEGTRWQFGDGVSPWMAGATFLILTAAWAALRGGSLLWGAVAAGYAALHLFASEPLPAMTLYRVLSTETGSFPTGNDPAHRTAHVLHATGVVTDIPRLVPPPPEMAARQAGPTWRFTLRLEDAEVDGRHWPCHAAVAAQWRDGAAELAAGDRLEITALAENVAPPRNPGEFDYAGHLRRRGILSSARIAGVADGRILPAPSGVGRSLDFAAVRRVAGRFHGWMERVLRLDLDDDPEAAAVVSTMLLGLSDPRGLDELEDVFQRTGTLHYFAVDGLKLGLVAFLLLRVLRSAGMPRPWPGVCVLPLLGGYVLATGLSVAALRALVFSLVIVGGELTDRPMRPLNSLGAAAAAVLLFDTQSVFALGFQLTFFNMLAILLLVRGVNETLRRLGAPDPFLPEPLYPWALRGWEWLRRGACEIAALSITAWLGSLPIMFMTFHLFSPVSLLANIVTFPLAFLTLALGVLALAGAAFSTALAVWFNNANWLCAKVFLWVARMFDALPGSSFAVASPAHWHWPAPAAELVVYDFDRGRAAFLHAGGRDWLIDAARLAEYTTGVLPSLRAHAVERLDGGLLLTQADADHLAAARLALADLHPASVIGSARANRSPLLRNFRKFLAGQGREEMLCLRGDVLSLGKDARMAVLYPPDDVSGKLRAAVDRALALRIEAAGWRVLMLTEGDGAAAQWLATQGEAGGVGCDVLVTAAPVSRALLAMARPRLVVLRASIVRKAAEVKVAGVGAEVGEVFTMTQRESGAVTLLIYPERIEVGGFVDGRRAVLRR